MAASIFEYSDGASTVMVTWGTNDPHVVNLIEADSREELGQVEFEASLGNAVFSYELLGDPDGNDEEASLSSRMNLHSHFDEE